MCPGVRIDIKLQIAWSNFILQKVVTAAPDLTVFPTSAILHVRKQLVMSSVALAIERLRARGDHIKLLHIPSRISNILLRVRVPTTIRNY